MREGSPSPLRVVRHAGQGGMVQRFDDRWREPFECYSRVQGQRKFGKEGILISFVKTEGRESNFLGVYRVNGVEPCPRDLVLPRHIPSDMVESCKTKWLYSLDRVTELDRFRGRIRILWDKVESRWVRQYQDANRKIVAVKDGEVKWVAPTDRGSLFKMGFVPPVEEFSGSYAGSYPEGARSLRRHLAIERNSALIRDSKARFKMQHGRLFCQGCGFDFVAVSGEEYIEFCR